MASARFAAATRSLPARSAIVRATRRARWSARAESERRSTAAAARRSTGGSRQRKRSKSLGERSALRKAGRDGNRETARRRASATRCLIVSEDSFRESFLIYV